MRVHESFRLNESESLNSYQLVSSFRTGFRFCVFSTSWCPSKIVPRDQFLSNTTNNNLPNNCNRHKSIMFGIFRKR